MRLADHIYARGSKSDRERLHDDPPPVLHAGDIATGFYLNRQLLFGPDDYPFARPPWPVCFVEWTEPKQIWTADGHLEIENPARIAVKLVTFEGDLMRATLQRLRTLIVVPADTAVLVAAEPSSMVRGQLREAPVTLFTFLNSDGFVLDHALLGDPGFVASIEAEKMDVRSVFAAHHVIPMLCFSFANCKNVSTVDVTAQHAQSEKIRRRLRLPVIKSYVLRISNKAYSRLETDPGDGTEGLLPHHLVRGHFANYTAEKPLFGNPKNIGRFWIPPHARGKKENGQVLKHYAVAPTKEAV